MISTIVSQVRRIINDDGRQDKDFSVQEEKLRSAQQHLESAASSLMRASQDLADVLNTKGLPN